MRVRVLLTCLLLAACGSGAEQPATVAEKEAAQIEAVRTMTGFDRVFASPVETVNSINQAGFGLPSYAAANGAFGAQGVDRLMSRSTAPSPNMGTAAVNGAAADRLDRIAYTLKIGDPQDAATARDRFATTVGEFLTRAGVTDGEPVLAAIRAGRSARPTVSGLPVTVAATPTRIDVTFSRPAATGASANS